MKTNKVVIDTNALIYAVQKKRDLFEDLTKYLGSFEIIVLERVKEELERKAAATGKTKANAKIAMEMLDKMRIVEFEKAGKSTDDLIIDYAEENDAYVYTYDKKLKQKCNKKRLKLVRIEAFEGKGRA
ncbi:TPA: PIN domain-containing protein [archaeon]|nr:PIN domain-containing protein [Candidatus Naiadarchaeales archaeon SRR2090153.bin461]